MEVDHRRLQGLSDKLLQSVVAYIQYCPQLCKAFYVPLHVRHLTFQAFIL
jgi:hypothetical protein